MWEDDVLETKWKKEKTNGVYHLICPLCLHKISLTKEIDRVSENLEKCPKCGAIMHMEDGHVKKDMDKEALRIAKAYIVRSLYEKDRSLDFKVFIVWKSKIIQNWKYMISSELPNGMYYELTYNGIKNQWYIDAYKKIENVTINDDTIEKWCDIL